MVEAKESGMDAAGAQPVTYEPLDTSPAAEGKSYDELWRRMLEGLCVPRHLYEGRTTAVVEEEAEART